MGTQRESAVVELIINGQQSLASLKEVEQEMRKVRAEFRKMREADDPERYKKLASDFQTLQGRTKELNTQLKGSVGWFQKLKDLGQAFGPLAIGFLGFQAITNQVRNIISSNAKLSDSLADVRKTTGLSEQAVKRLNNELKNINTRSSRQELLELAYIAGKLGITAEKDVLGFVRAADKIKVALAKDLGGNVEEAINHIGKLVDIFHVKEKFGIEESMLKVGSAINALGAASTANEGYIVEFTKRFGGIAPNAKISIQDTLGLAATMDQLGQTSEVSTTAIGSILIAMGKDIPKFAKIAGVSIKEFRQLLATDTNAAFIKVLEGARSSKEGLEGVVETLGDMGTESKRAAGVIGILTKNTEILRQQQKLSNDEFTKGTSIIDEFNIKNETFGAKVEKLQKIILSWVSNASIKGMFSGIVDGLISLFTPTDNYLQKSTEIIRSNRQQAQTAQALLSEYESLSRDGIVPTTAEKNRLTDITYQLRDALGDSVVQINKETGALEVNKEAVKDAIKQKLLLVNNEASTLALKSNALQDEKNNLEDLEKILARELESRKRIRKELETASPPSISPSSTKEEIEAYTKMDLARQKSIATAEKLRDVQDKMLEKEKERGKILQQLNVLGFTEDDVNKIFAVVTEASTTAGEGIQVGMEELSEEAKKQLEKLREEISGIEEKILLDQQGKHQAEITSIELKYDKLRKKAEGHAAEIVRINAAEKAEIESKEAEHNKIIDELRDKLYFSRLSKDEQELQTIREKYQKQIDEFSGFLGKIQELEKLRDQELEQKSEEQRQRRLKEQTDLQEEIYRMTLSQNEQEIYDENQKWERLIERAAKYGLDVTALYRAQAAAITAIVKKQGEDEVKSESSTDKKILESRKKLFDGLSDIINGLGDIASAAGAESFELNKGITVAQIAIDTASAISSLTKSSEANPANSATGGIAGIIQFASGILRIFANMARAASVLNSAPPPKHEKGVLLEGPSHENKGIKMIRSDTGEQVGEAEGGELLLSNEFVNQNPALASYLLQSSQRNHGQISAQELLRRVYSVTPGVNFSRIIETTRIEKYTQGTFIMPVAENGGRALANNLSNLSTDNPTTDPSSANQWYSSSDAPMIMMQQMMEVISKTNAVLDDIYENGIEAIINPRKLARDTDRFKRITGAK